MMVKTINRPVILTVVLMTLAGCGIEQGDVQGGNEIPTGVVLFGPKIGPVGGLTVNGESLNTLNATISADGAAISEEGLRDGQLIKVLAEDNIALTVEYQENLRGPAENVDTVVGTFSVLSQTVTVNDSTVFDSLNAQNLDELIVGTAVEISGYTGPNGELIASYVGNVEPGEPFSVTASVSAVDIAATTFSIGNLVVDFSQSQILDIPGGAPVAGLVLEIQGTLDSAGAFLAAAVRSIPLPGSISLQEFADASLASGGDGLGRVNVSGIISEANSSTILLGAVEVLIGTSTIVDGGSVDDLQLGVLVQVIGNVTPTNTVDAIRIVIL